MPTGSEKIIFAVAGAIACLGVVTVLLSAIVKRKNGRSIPSFLEVWLKTKMPVILIAYFPLTSILGIVLIITANAVGAGIFFILSIAVYFISSFIAVNNTGRKMIKNRVDEERQKREELKQNENKD